MDNCVFCNPYSNIKNPEYLMSGIYMFTPLNPVVPGHKLFISSEHSEDAANDPDIYAEVSRLAALYGGIMGVPFNLITSSGKEATQSVFHLHVHYVPRAKDDGLRLPWTAQQSHDLTGFQHKAAEEKNSEK